MVPIAIRLSKSIGHIALLSIDARRGIETVHSQLLQHEHQESQTASRHFTNRPDASKMQDAGRLSGPALISSAIYRGAIIDPAADL